MNPLKLKLGDTVQKPKELCPLKVVNFNSETIETPNHTSTQKAQRRREYKFTPFVQQPKPK